MSIYDRLYALAKEIDDNVHRVEEVAKQTAEQRFQYPIAGGLGNVTITGNGQLLSVDLDPRALRYVNGRELGRQVTRAIREAESSSMAMRQQQIAEAQQSVSL